VAQFSKNGFSVIRLLGGSCSLCLTLDELARVRLGSFCFILLAMKYRGATGCPVRSIALV